MEAPRDDHAPPSRTLQTRPSMAMRSSVGKIITSLHERVTAGAQGRRGRDLTYRWNKPFIVASQKCSGTNPLSCLVPCCSPSGACMAVPHCIVPADVWHEAATAQIMAPQTKPSLRDGGLCATPELPFMDLQDLVYNKQRLQRIQPDIAKSRHEYIRKRNWGIRPDWVSAASSTDLESTAIEGTSGKWHQDVASDGAVGVT